MIQLYFAFNARETADGLTQSTFRIYRQDANRHCSASPEWKNTSGSPRAAHAVRFAAQPASAFNEPATPRALREAMKHAKVGPNLPGQR